TVFVKLTFTARAGAGGRGNLGLGSGSMIDQAGSPLVPRLIIGGVAIGAGGAAGGSAQPTTSPAASSEPAASASSLPEASPVSPTTPVKVSLAPTSLTLKSGDTARVFLIADSAGNLSSVVADLAFDKDKLQVLALDPGPSWAGATLIAVSKDRSAGVAAAIAEANTTGVLQAAGAFFPPGFVDLPYGQGVFVSVMVKARAEGTSNLSIGNAAALGVSGETVPVAIDAGSLTKPPAKGIELDPTLVIPLVALLVVAIGSLFAIRTGRVPVRIQRRWPFYLSLLLGLVPVAAFVLVVALVVIESAPVLDTPGLGALLGTTFANKYSAFGSVGGSGTQFGLVPAVWGSLLVATIAVGTALPISLALAIVAVDFPLGPVTRLVRPLVGVLGGIPPIVYAVSLPVFITAFMIPKFAADSTFGSFDPASIGATWPANHPPAGVPLSAGGLPWDLTGVANSTLMGGVLVALFLVPFATPLMVDALRDVPQAAREASIALGANRTYTIRRVVLPRALPALTGASMLAVLKALGDTIIVAWAVGWTAERLPVPLFDVLERTTSLAAQGAGMIGSFETNDATCTGAECAAGYASALVLLLVAGVVVLVISYLQATRRRRLAV
ncbi:MAG TPA: ABC transporter permease subunit, partial [Candidatus Dormibacteraeota bacterium]|nr:ABC transporter permease subunit [Candidatus Dormibacteraeota bacterium]